MKATGKEEKSSFLPPTSPFPLQSRISTTQSSVLTIHHSAGVAYVLVSFLEPVSLGLELWLGVFFFTFF